MGLIPGQRRKIPHASWCDPKKKKLHNYKFKDILQMKQPITIKTSQYWKTKKDWTNGDTYFKRASLVVQMVKNLPSMWETWVRSLAWENPLEEGMATHSSILAWIIPKDSGAWWATVHGDRKESDMTKHYTFTAHIKRDYRDMTKLMVWAWMVSWNKQKKIFSFVKDSSWRKLNIVCRLIV